MKLNLGQAVQFIDRRTGPVRHGEFIVRHDKQATVLEEDVRRTRKVPYVAPGVQDYGPSPEPAAPAAIVAFRVGDKATFDDGKGVIPVGHVTRIHRRTATRQAIDENRHRDGSSPLRQPHVAATASGAREPRSRPARSTLGLAVSGCAGGYFLIR